MPAGLVNVCYDFYFDRREGAGACFACSCFSDQCCGQSTHSLTEILLPHADAGNRRPLRIACPCLFGASFRAPFHRPQAGLAGFAGPAGTLARHGRLPPVRRKRTRWDVFGPLIAAAKVADRITRSIECAAPTPREDISAARVHSLAPRSGACWSPRSVHRRAVPYIWEKGTLSSAARAPWRDRANFFDVEPRANNL